jgi:hypothetical protein
MIVSMANTNPNPKNSTPITLCRHISPISAIKAQIRVQFWLNVEANDRWVFLLLGVDVDVVCLEAGAGSVGVALEDEAFGLRGVETLIVPAGLYWRFIS